MGKLLVFEGVDGCGKTTLSAALTQFLRAAGFDCERHSFPGKRPGTLGRHVYDLHHRPKNLGVQTITATSLQVLHVAAHIDAIETRILPALRRGTHVILDRFWWSTWAYGIRHGATRRSLSAMIALEKLHWNKVRPAQVFLIKTTTKAGGSAAESARRLKREYDLLAKSEKCRHPVAFVHNDGTVSQVLANILRVLRNKRPFSTQPGINSESILFKNPPRFATPTFSRPMFNVLTKLSPAKPTVVYDTYWRFAAERQAIFFRRFQKQFPPWTEDPILRRHKFTNAYRASDRTSQYLIRRVIYEGDQGFDEVFFRTLLFKIFNRRETWELLTRELGPMSVAEFNYAKFDSVLSEASSRGEPIYSAAYIMPSGGGSAPGGRKHRMHLRLLEKMVEDNLPARLTQAPSMGRAFEMLREYPTIGDFLAYQYVTDLNYGPLLNFTEMDFVIPGPGARDGIRKCFRDFGGLSEAEIIKVVAERQSEEFERLGLGFQSLWGRPLQLIDCQNLFCEVGKYARVRHPEFAGHTGRARIKQNYRMTPEPIEYWYPPKWGVNERISQERKYVPSF
jgi:thymidylate kinase